MAKMVVKTGKGWGSMTFAMDPAKHTALVDAHVRRATALNATYLISAIRKEIKTGTYTPNRALTVSLKGSSKPLVGKTAQLWQSITKKEINEKMTFVGVLRTDAEYNVAVTVHQGVVLKVTDKMRGLFFVLWKMSQGEPPTAGLSGRAAELWAAMPGNWLPLKASTSAINIPSRPFIRNTLKDSDVRKTVRTNWRQALRAAYREMATK